MPSFHEQQAIAERVSVKLSNKKAVEGCDRCYCGCKYWEHDRCIDCGTSIEECLADPEWVAQKWM